MTTQYDLTSADSKIIGFDFQYFYFINKLLQLAEGQTIGFEDKDDVHIETNCALTLIQIKHTKQRSASGKPISLSKFDEDLWKTLSNWVKVVCDKAESRDDETKQMNFLKKTEFILATNKSISSNQIISSIDKYKKKEMSFSELYNYLNGLLSETENKNIKTYIQNVLTLSRPILQMFLSKVRFIDTGSEIVEDIRKSIRNKMIAENHINDVFNDLFAELRLDFFSRVGNGEHQEISHEEWLKKYTPIFTNYRTTQLPIRKFHKLPDNLIEQPFIKELIAIGDINADDLSQISEFTSFMLDLEMNLKLWHDDGHLTMMDIESLHEDAIHIWKNSHRKNHRSTRDKDADKQNALNCLDEIRDKDLSLKDTSLKVSISNGEFYHLSNEREIGWLKKWEDKY